MTSYLNQTSVPLGPLMVMTAAYASYLIEESIHSLISNHCSFISTHEYVDILFKQVRQNNIIGRFGGFYEEIIYLE